jgi:hypothetical protein
LAQIRAGDGCLLPDDLVSGRVGMSESPLTPAARRRRFEDGRNYWLEYVQLNGYAFEPNRAGLRKLSGRHGVAVSHLARCIAAFLEA